MTKNSLKAVFVAFALIAVTSAQGGPWQPASPTKFRRATPLLKKTCATLKGIEKATCTLSSDSQTTTFSADSLSEDLTMLVTNIGFKTLRVGSKQNFIPYKAIDDFKKLYAPKALTFLAQVIKHLKELSSEEQATLSAAVQTEEITKTIFVILQNTGIKEILMLLTKLEMLIPEILPALESGNIESMLSILTERSKSIPKEEIKKIVSPENAKELISMVARLSNGAVATTCPR